MASNITWHAHHVSKQSRSEQKKQCPCVLWFTGLSGSGKSTIASALEKTLFDEGYHTYLLDGDNVRHGLNKDLGFSDDDRIENIRRVGELSKLFVDAGLLVMCAFISPFKNDRELVRKMLHNDYEFVEIYMSTSLAVCESRDSKGLYQKARKGLIKNFTGIDSEYEVPKNPDIEINTGILTVEECVEKIFLFLKKNNYVRKHQYEDAVNNDYIETGHA